ncbi:hypothetical protein PACTADRAFT_18348 [Pachysolen tannophilus NRRL Y-2460]|uniref:Meiotic nuclear division protein 1 n=1 Tax=Pachysolen tannophilus NRRL Y-2460 TaxID=669874 RepID=A0A1E4TPW0_PACTA|nr:hypothetical protein PACTADRAFT_18348 [Pachysolen tannophilus NRRL Y-2460]
MQVAKRGLSLEEKKIKLLDFFKRKHEFYNIKEVENAGSKFTGISSMQIKEVLQNLLDENLVNCEKCGISNLYWVFEFEIQKKLNQEHTTLSNKIQDLRQKKTDVEETIGLELDKRIEKIDKFTKRSDLIKELENLNQIKFQNTEKLELLKENDPKTLENLQKNFENLKNAAEIYTDNIEALLYHFSNDPIRPIPKSDLRKELNIPEELVDLTYL